MMSQRDFTFKVGKEITQYLLCESCEGKLSKNGEDYFARVAMPVPEAQSPPLLFRLLHVSLIPLWNRMGALRFSLGSSLILQVDSKSIFYFAISMFWRGGLEGWKGYKHVRYEDGLMELMRNFLLGRGKFPGYIVRVLPSFWAEKYSAVLPLKHKGIPFFSIYMYDFYLEKISESSRNYEARSDVPIIYTADSFKSVESHDAMTTVLQKAKRAKGLPATGDLISWGHRQRDTN